MIRWDVAVVVVAVVLLVVVVVVAFVVVVSPLCLHPKSPFRREKYRVARLFQCWACSPQTRVRTFDRGDDEWRRPAGVVVASNGTTEQQASAPRFAEPLGASNDGVEFKELRAHMQKIRGK
jgi:hypothetical protein